MKLLEPDSPQCEPADSTSELEKSTSEIRSPPCLVVTPPETSGRQSQQLPSVSFSRVENKTEEWLRDVTPQEKKPSYTKRLRPKVNRQRLLNVIAAREQKERPMTARRDLNSSGSRELKSASPKWHDAGRRLAYGLSQSVRGERVLHSLTFASSQQNADSLDGNGVESLPSMLTVHTTRKRNGVSRYGLLCMEWASASSNLSSGLQHHMREDLPSHGREGRVDNTGNDKKSAIGKTPRRNYPIFHDLPALLLSHHHLLDNMEKSRKRKAAIGQ